MNRLEKKLSEIKTKGRKGLSVFLTAGYPQLTSAPALVAELERAGADFIEIGFPFSDPVAEGATIQKSSEVALKNGMNWERLLGDVRQIRKSSEIPLIFMSYANTLFCRGWEKSAAQLADAGIDGIIAPDLIPEQSVEQKKIFENRGLSLIYLCSPTSSDKRIKDICRQSSGFVYCVSVTGVTGARKDLPHAEIIPFLKKVKKESRLPVFLGFGISEPSQLDALDGAADGYIIGSAAIRILGQSKPMQEIAADLKSFIGRFVEKL